MAAPDASFPLSTPESIVLDGANSVTGAPRQHFPDAPLSLGLAAVVLIATFVALRTRWARVVVPVLLLVAAVPGLSAVLFLRADAPGRRAPLTALVRVGVNDLQRVARWPDQAVRVTRDDDDVLFPLARYAWPSRPVALDGGVEVELRGSSLMTACRHDAVVGRTVCGVGR